MGWLKVVNMNSYYNSSDISNTSCINSSLFVFTAMAVKSPEGFLSFTRILSPYGALYIISLYLIPYSFRKSSVNFFSLSVLDVNNTILSVSGIPRRNSFALSSHVSLPSILYPLCLTNVPSRSSIHVLPSGDILCVLFLFFLFSLALYK